MQPWLIAICMKNTLLVLSLSHGWLTQITATSLKLLQYKVKTCFLWLREKISVSSCFTPLFITLKPYDEGKLPLNSSFVKTVLWIWTDSLSIKILWLRSMIWRQCLLQHKYIFTKRLCSILSPFSLQSIPLLRPNEQ